MKWAMAALALATSLFSGAALSQDKPAFVFTAIPDQDETRLVERFTRVADLLQSKLGIPVKYLPVKSYPAAVTAFTNGQVHLPCVARSAPPPPPPPPAHSPPTPPAPP